MYCTSGLSTALCLVISLYAMIVKALDSQKFTLGRQAPPSFRAPSPNTPAAHILPLTGKSGSSKSAGYLQSLRQGNQVNGVYGLTSVTYVAEDLTFVTNLEFGKQSFQAQIDTGSSDTWLVGNGFQCVDEASGAQESESECMFGPTYTISPTFKRIPNEHFRINYGGGGFFTGIVGNETVTLAGITVEDQEVAVVDYVADVSDGVTSGVIGLSFKSSTSVYTGANQDAYTKKVEYNPIFTSMYSRGYILPIFSLAIERSPITNGTTAGGLLAIGGLPPVPFRPLFASSPFQLLTINSAPVAAAASQSADPNLAYSFYAITVTGLTYERSNETKWSHPNFPNPLEPPSNASHIQVVIDSGSTLIYLPTGIASAVNALFDPAAVYDAGSDAYLVNCSAKAPKFGVEIGGQTFFVNGKDLILDYGIGNGICASGITEAGSGMSILGDVFLKNVLAIFDVGSGEMRFAAREFY